MPSRTRPSPGKTPPGSRLIQHNRRHCMNMPGRLPWHVACESLAERMSSPSSDPAVPITVRLGFHRFQSIVVVRKLLEMSPCDLAGEDRIVAGDVSLRIMGAVLELDLHAAPELLDVEGGCLPIDTDRLPDRSCLFGCHGLHCHFITS